MSTESFARAVGRESIIWPSFIYSAPVTPEQAIERNLIYGLHANAYLNGHGYLSEVEAVELINLLNDYNMKVAGLSADEQALIIQIAAKRSVAEIERIIHANKLATKYAELEQNLAIMAAKYEAIATDEAAYQTLLVRLSAEQQKTMARIQVLEAEISEEVVRTEMAEVEVSEKNIQLLETQLRIDNVAIEIAKINLQIIQAASEIIEVDLRSAELKNRTASVDIEAIRAGFTANEVEIARAETTLEEGMTNVAEQENINATNRETMLGTKLVPSYTAMKPLVETNIVQKAIAQTQINKNELARMANAVAENDRKNTERKKSVELEGIGLTADNSVRDNQTTTADLVNDAEQGAQWSMANAAVNAARTLASAEITTKLTHIIGKTEKTA